MALIDITPIMTSNTTPTPYGVSASSTFNPQYSAWNAFDNIVTDGSGDGWVSTASPNQWLKIDFSKDTEIDAYEITNRGFSGDIKVPKAWILQGSNDDLTWVDLDIRVNEFTEQLPMSKKIFKLNSRFSYRYYRLYINEYHNPSSYISIGQLRFLKDDSNGYIRENKFKAPISVDGYIKMKNLVSSPSNPTSGDIIIFVKNGKLYQVDDTGTETEIGSGTSISGKVVTGVESLDNKIVISFNDGTSEDVPVITDVTKIEEKIESVEKDVSSLRVRSYAGDELEYGTIHFVSESQTNKGIYEFSSLNIQDGNIVGDKEKITLTKGKTYSIDCSIRFNGSQISDTMITSGGKRIGYVSYNSSLSTWGNDSSKNFTYTPTDNEILGYEFIVNVPVFAITVCIQEIGRTYIHDPVKSVDELSGIQDTPVGNIISHIGLTAPAHYLVCDGKTYNIVDYPKLAEHFMEQFGSYNYFGGDGTTTFAVPDMRGEFIRGYDPTKVRDPQGNTRGIGKHQDATEQKMLATSATSSKAQVRWKNDAWDSHSKEDKTISIPSQPLNYGEIAMSKLQNTSGNDLSIGYTARPTNVNVLYCIKYEPTYYMEYHPKYASFKTDILFSGNITENGNYSLKSSIQDYDFVGVRSRVVYPDAIINCELKLLKIESHDMIFDICPVDNTIYTRLSIISDNVVKVEQFKNQHNMKLDIYEIIGIKGSIDSINPPTGGSCDIATEEEFNNVMSDIIGGIN